MFLSDEKTSKLLKMATLYADAKDWDNAIESCKKAKQSIIESVVSYPTATLCKLGLYYARAGKFEEAISELNSLFELIPRLQEKFYCAETHWPAPLQKDLLEDSCFCHFKTVHESMRTVYKRAKMFDLAEQQDVHIEACEKKHNKHRRKYDSWERKAASARKKAIQAEIKKAFKST